MIKKCLKVPGTCWTAVRRWLASQWRIRYALHRHGQLLAYILVAAMSFWALHLGLDNARDDREALADSARKTVRIACEADRDNAVALRAALKGNIRFVRNANEPPPPTVGERVEQLEKLIESIAVPDCDARVALIRDGD